MDKRWWLVIAVIILIIIGFIKFSNTNKNVDLGPKRSAVDDGTQDLEYERDNPNSKYTGGSMCFASLCWFVNIGDNWGDCTLACECLSGCGGDYLVGACDDAINSCTKPK